LGVDAKESIQSKAVHTMDESAPLPPRSPSSGIAILGSSDDLINLPAPKLMGRGTNRKHRRKKSRISPIITSTTMEGPLTPPLLSPNGDAKMDKKRSPTSTFDFDHAEEMKVAVNDESYQESIVRILHNKLTSPSLERHSHAYGRSRSIEREEKVETVSSKERPPLKSDPNSSPTHSNEYEGELGMMSLADDCLANQDVTTALALYKSLLQELDKKYGRENALTAYCIHKLGEANLILGEFQKAINYLDTAINIRSVVLGVHHIDVANSMEKLAVAQLHLNEVENAHDVYRRALRIKRSFLGLYHEDVAHIQTQLACIYFYSGELLSAQATFEEALDVYRHLASQPTAIHGFWAVKSADTLCSIGSIKLKQRNYSRAIGYFVDALKVRPRHILCAVISSNG
jgi:tetratricopeptide (TPR) repeat protein